MALQNHIHLSTTLDGAPENAPSFTWGITERSEVPTVVAALKRTLTGKLMDHVLKDDSGVVQFMDYRYLVRIMAEGGYTIEERKAQLQAMQGKTVYLVDNYHAADGADHTSDVQAMFVAEMGSFDKFDAGLQRFYIEIYLTDNNRVT